MIQRAPSLGSEKRKLGARNKFHLPKGFIVVVFAFFALSLFLTESFSVKTSTVEVINFVPACLRNVTIIEERIAGYENITISYPAKNVTNCDSFDFETGVCSHSHTINYEAYNETKRMPVYENESYNITESWDCDLDYDLIINDFEFKEQDYDLDINFTCKAVSQNAVGKDLPVRVKVPTKALDNMVNSRAITSIPQELSQKIRITNVANKQDIKDNPIELHCGENSAVFSSLVLTIYSADNGIVKLRYDSSASDREDFMRFYSWDNATSDWLHLSSLQPVVNWEDSENVACTNERIGQSILSQTEDKYSLLVSCGQTAGSGRYFNMTFDIIQGYPNIKYKLSDIDEGTSSIDYIEMRHYVKATDVELPKLVNMFYSVNGSFAQTESETATIVGNLERNYFLMLNTSDDFGWMVSFDEDKDYMRDYHYGVDTSSSFVYAHWSVDNDIGGWDNDTSNKSWWFTPLLNIDTVTNSDASSDTFNQWTTKDSPTNYTAYWKLDDGSGTTADDSSGNSDYDGTITESSWVEAKMRYGLHFDGINDIVTMDTFATDSAANTTGTFSFWIYPHNFTSFYGILAIADGGDASSYFEIITRSSTGLIQFSIVEGGDNHCIMRTGNGLNVRQWNHVVITRDTGGVRIYLDGSQETLTESSGTTAGCEWLDHVNSIDVGRMACVHRSDANVLFNNATLDDVRYYPHAVTQAQVTDLYGIGVPDCFDSPTGCRYWDYDFGDVAANISQAVLNISTWIRTNNTDLDIWRNRTWSGNKGVIDDWEVSNLYLMPYPENSTNWLYVTNLNITSIGGSVPVELGATARTNVSYQTKGLLLVPSLLYNGILGGTNRTTYNVTLQNSTDISSLTLNTTYYFWEWWEPKFVFGTTDITVDGVSIGGLPIHNITYNDVALNGRTQSVFHPVQSYYYVNGTETNPTQSMERTNETYSIDYWFNITHLNETSFNASLWWNLGASNVALLGYDTKTNTSVSNYTYTKYFVTPLQNESYQNIIVRNHWNHTYALVNGSDGTHTGQNDTSWTVTVYKAFFGNCTNTTSATSIIFELKDFNKTLINSSIEASFDITLDDNTNRTITGIDWNGNNTYSICIAPPYESFYLDGDIKYTAGGYEIRKHYLRNQSFSNTSTTINLYEIVASDGYPVKIVVQDNLQVKKKDVLVRLMRWRFSKFRYEGPVDSGITSDEGETILYVQPIWALYKIILLNETTGDAITDKSFITFYLGADNLVDTYTITLTGTESVFEQVGDVSYSCNFDTNQNMSGITYTSKRALTMHSEIRQINGTNSSVTPLMCDNSSTSLSGSLYCSVGDIHGSFAHVFWAEFDTFNHTYDACGYYHEKFIKFDFGFEGVFVTFLLIGTLSLAGVSATASMIFMVIGVVGASNLQIIKISWEATMALIVIAGVIIFLSKRN